MQRSLHTPILLMALALSPAALWAKPFDEVRWDSSGKFDQRRRIEPGGHHELCAPLQRGQRVATEFDAGAALDYNVHFHFGGGTTYAVEKTGVSRMRHSVSAAKERNYCWMWTNPGTEPVSLHVRLKLTAKP